MGIQFTNPAAVWKLSRQLCETLGWKQPRAWSCSASWPATFAGWWAFRKRQWKGLTDEQYVRSAVRAIYGK